MVFELWTVFLWAIFKYSSEKRKTKKIASDILINQKILVQYLPPQNVFYQNVHSSYLLISSKAHAPSLFNKPYQRTI